jgi:exopolysaccharide biosynthesis polyprenyl glycosylphosphotransferase
MGEFVRRFVTKKTRNRYPFSCVLAVCDKPTNQGDSFNIMKSWLKQHYNSVLLWSQVVVDYVTITGTIYLSYWLWINSSGLRLHKNPGFLPFQVYLAIGVLFVLILKISGAYEREHSIAHVNEHRSLLRGVFWGYGILIAIAFFYPKIYLSRLQSIYAILTLAVVVVLERYVFYQINRYMLKKGIGTKKILVYGAGATGQRLVRHLNSVPKLGYKVVGYVDDEKFGTQAEAEMHEHDTKVLGKLENIKELTTQYEVDEMFITMPSATSQRISQIVKTCNGNLPKYRFVPSMSDFHLQQIKLESINGIPLCAIKEHQPNFVSATIKRCFDFAFSAAILIATSPLMALIALKIKRDSEGPVIFRQQRVGKDGKLFTMYKFRTMYTNVLPYAYTPTAKTDPRITPFGRFLRKASLDELPQFWNVLLGDMSVVGPRPEMEFIVNKYNDIQRQRLLVKPGITGIWQISPDRSRPIHEAIEHDLYYIENQSILLDLILIWETLVFGIRGI